METTKKEMVDFINEATQIHNETGLTPRQLLEQRDALIQSLASAEGALEYLWERLIPMKTSENDLMKELKVISQQRNWIKEAIQKTTKEVVMENKTTLNDIADHLNIQCEKLTVVKNNLSRPPCKHCNGTGEVYYKNEKHECPVCHGEGVI